MSLVNKDSLWQASTTGEMFTQQQYDQLTITQREKVKIVGGTPEESEMLSGMNRKQRRAWMKANKKFKQVSRACTQFGKS